MAYCDGSGKGWICTVLDYGEPYQRLYIDTVEDPVYHEYHAILHALKHMVPELEYNLYNDNVGVVSHLTGNSNPRTPIIKQLVAQIMGYITDEGLSVNIHHLPRGANPAGKLLDTKARHLYAMREHGLYVKPNQSKKKTLEQKKQAKRREDVDGWWKGLDWYKKTEVKGKTDTDRGTSNNLNQQPQLRLTKLSTTCEDGVSQ